MALSKNEIKYVKSLHLKKFRQKYNNFIVEGDKIVRELLASSNFQIEALYGENNWLSKHGDHIRSSNFPLHTVSGTELERISTLKTPNQVLVIVRMPTFRYSSDKLNSSLSLYLDDIRDPGNFGTILRIADWFGLPYVFCSPTSAAWTNPKVIQASMGAFLRIQVHSMELSAVTAMHPDLPIFGMVLGGQSITELSRPDRGIIVIGNESRGIGQNNLKYLTQRVTIPRHPEGGAESLNAAVATGIICAQWGIG